MIIDSHCHLNRLKLEDCSLDQIIEDARQKGVSQMISVATTLQEMTEIKAISDHYPHVFYSVGIHPSEANAVKSAQRSDIILYTKENKCVAIGETGLDYYYNDKSTYALQQESFFMHLAAANAVNKPVIVHTRSAKADTLRILKEGQVEKCGGVLHCFTEDWDMAKQALDLGMYISFSGIVTFKNAGDIQAVAKKIPSDRILIETDAPYLTPVPFRGKSNYPAYVYYVAEYLANLRQQPLDEFCQITYENTQRCFAFPVFASAQLDN